MLELTMVSSVPERPEDPTAGVEEQLWVDRYRPEKFTELVGDERVHREAMAWLKEWDECVFKKKKKKPKAKETVIGKKRGWDDGDGGDAGRFAEKDEFGRPRERVRRLSSKVPQVLMRSIFGLSY
jgi:chromosome transmission fidelity protein 18